MSNTQNVRGFPALDAKTMAAKRKLNGGALQAEPSRGIGQAIFKALRRSGGITFDGLLKAAKTEQLSRVVDATYLRAWLNRSYFYHAGQRARGSENCGAGWGFGLIVADNGRLSLAEPGKSRKAPEKAPEKAKPEAVHNVPAIVPAA